MASDNELRPRKTTELIDETLRELEALTGYQLLGDAGHSNSGVFLAYRPAGSSADDAHDPRPTNLSHRPR